MMSSKQFHQKDVNRYTDFRNFMESNCLVCFKGVLILFSTFIFYFWSFLIYREKKQNHRTGKVNLLCDLNSRLRGKNLLPGPSDFSKDPRYLLYSGSSSVPSSRGRGWCVCCEQQKAPSTGSAPGGHSSSCLRAQLGLLGLAQPFSLGHCCCRIQKQAWEKQGTDKINKKETNSLYRIKSSAVVLRPDN